MWGWHSILGQQIGLYLNPDSSIYWLTLAKTLNISDPQCPFIITTSTGDVMRVVNGEAWYPVQITCLVRIFWQLGELAVLCFVSMRWRPPAPMHPFLQYLLLWVVRSFIQDGSSVPLQLRQRGICQYLLQGLRHSLPPPGGQEKVGRFHQKALSSAQPHPTSLMPFCPISFHTSSSGSAALSSSSMALPYRAQHTSAQAHSLATCWNKYTRMESRDRPRIRA